MADVRSTAPHAATPSHHLLTEETSPLWGRFLATAGLIAFFCTAGNTPIFSQSFEAITEKCRETIGRPLVQACMQGKGRGGDREANLAECRGKATPAVRACSTREMKRVAASKPPPSIPGAGRQTAADAAATPAGFVAPPRSIADITAILDREKPDAAAIEKTRRDAELNPPASASREDLAQFYYDRGNARAKLGRAQESLLDAEKALETGRGAVELRMMSRLRQFVGMQRNAIGDPRRALTVFLDQVREGNQPGQMGTRINAARQASQLLISMGDLGQAEGYIRMIGSLAQEARGSPHPNWRRWYPVYGTSWEADADLARAMLFEAKGQFREAEAAYIRAEAFHRETVKKLPQFEYPPPAAQLLLAADADALGLARVKARQGRLAEAEVDARRALLGALKEQGKYNISTSRFVLGLASILVEQGRYADAEKLMRAALDIQRTLGAADDTQMNAQILAQLGGVLNLQRKGKEAAVIYAQLDKAIANWEPQRKQVLQLNGSRIYSLYDSGQIDAGIAAAQELLKREIARVGERHFDAAAARGTLAVGYMRARRDADAIREFKAAIPLLMSAARENADDDDTSVVAARADRVTTVTEAYISLLARNQNASAEVAVETFSLADAIRGHSVQQALAASSARMLAKDPALAALVRKEQDQSKQINAQLGLLNNVLSLPSNERDEKGVRAINASIDKLRQERQKARAEINQKFPSYADLVDPKPPSVEQIRASLRDGESLLSFYFGRDGSFVWAVPKSGVVAFASIGATGGEIETKVKKLREALEPQAALVSDIPAFDLALGHDLYAALLRPVEAGWKNAKSLIVVTNGALGLLPLSLLPTAPAKADDAGGVLFSGYRNVPWLARTHAVTMVPSAAALRTLRQLPPGKASRQNLIAFGDPVFGDDEGKAQAAGQGVQMADANLATRGVPLKRRNAPQLDGVDSAELAMLPQLPDTADELRSIALALQADPSKVLNLGKDASEAKVKSLDLSGFKILAFATHGLVPGELNGLTQPALALSSPKVAGGGGDGLLTMEEILALKLDADWVVLSACNTGAGAGAGAEAASGLGRAFFYAGTRALLVTNWSVHSQSARELVTDLFKRQADSEGMARGEALRQAMTALIDGPGYTDNDGKAQFAYAHPLFWAPYSIIGDGGAQ